MRGSKSIAMLALACVVAAGCDDNKEVERKELEAAAAAALGDGIGKEEKEAEAKAAEERKRKFEAQKAKEAEENAKLDAIAATVVKAPDKPSKNLADACEKYMLIYEYWVKAVYFDQDGFQLNFFEEKHKNLGAVKGKCAKLDSVPATDCMTEVVKGVSAEGFSEADRKLIQERPDYLFDKCVEKFAPEKLP
jgi:hypothetical protein